MLRDDVLIENNKYGCVIMQNNGAMKLANFKRVNGWNQAFFPLSVNAGYDASVYCTLASHFAPPFTPNPVDFPTYTPLYAPTSSFASSSYCSLCSSYIFLCLLVLLPFLLFSFDSVLQDCTRTNRAAWVRVTCCTVSATSDRSHDNAQATSSWTIHPLGGHVG